MSFPCITCSVVLPNSQEQRSHYKGDWHRYNLKRKVTGLLPVTLNEFNIKSALFSKPNESSEDPGVAEELPHCSVCHKKFSSQKAYDNHASSRKHQQKLAEAELAPAKQQSDKQQWVDAESDAGSDSDSETPLGLEECLFCSHISSSPDSNCAHMLRHHGFMLPHPERISDLEGVLTLLGYKVGVGYECLWCHETRGFESVRAVQQHMADSGHCRYNLTGDHAFDLADFYDFGDAGEDDDEEEDDDDDMADAGNEAYELVLPSGAVCGHRSLMRYFRQSLPPQRAVAIKQQQSAAQRLMSQYRAIGWSGATGAGQAAAIRDLAFVQRHRQKMRQKLGVGNNRLQKHYRLQNPI